MNIKNDKNEIDLMEYWHIIVKRKWVIAAFTGALIFFTGVFSFLATPKYKSTVTLHIDEEFSKILSLEETFGYQAQVRDMRFFNTQLRLLKSKTLIERVSRKMNLLAKPEFGGRFIQKKNFFTSLKKIITLRWLRPKKDKEERAPKPAYLLNPYSDITKLVRARIKVEPIRDTKLVDISFTSSDSVLSADLINTLAEEFISFSVEKRYENTQQASDFLSEQIASIREELASKERELQRYGQEKELVFLSDDESQAVNKYSELYREYTLAQTDRVKAYANYSELRDLNVDAATLPEFVTNPTIQQLNTEYTRLRNDYGEKIKTYKPDHPEMVQLGGRIESVKGDIKKAVEAIESEYRAALQRERNLKALLDNEKAEVAVMNSNAIRYNSLRIEVDNKRDMLRSLVEKQNETQISSQLGKLKTSNIIVIDKAEVSKYPVSPRKKLNLILAIIFGLTGGIGLCFLLEYLDNTVKGPDDVERLSKLPSLGVVSHLPTGGIKNDKMNIYGNQDPNLGEGLPDIKEVALINHLYPKLFIAEDYRTVRTSLLLSHVDNAPKNIVFTSALPKEGKTSTVSNMAVSFAQLEKRVLLIDTDLRKPRLHHIFNTKNDKGLSGYLVGRFSLGEAVQSTSIDNIWLLSSGLIPPNPAELLNSKRMVTLLNEVKNDYDVILIDTSPVLAVVDPIITASLADTTVFIIKAGKTTNKNFVYAIEELKKARVDIAGVVFNEVKIGGGYNYMSYYNYSRTSYYMQDGIDID